MDAWLAFQDQILTLAVFCLIVGGVFGLFIGLSLNIERTK